VGAGTGGASAVGGTKSPCAPPARTDDIDSRVDAAAAKADGEGDASEGSATGAPTKVVPGAGEELPRSERGVERTETVAAARVGSASQTEGPLWRPAATGDSVEPPARAIAEAILEAAVVLGAATAA
jgi:hypothetical protein